MEWLPLFLLNLKQGQSLRVKKMRCGQGLRKEDKIQTIYLEKLKNQTFYRNTVGLPRRNESLFENYNHCNMDDKSLIPVM